MDNIINFFENNGIHYQKMSDNMVLFGFNDTYLCGTISFYNKQPLCRFHYFNGTKKYFKDFYFTETEFHTEYTKASSGYIYMQNKAIDDILNVLD